MLVCVVFLFGMQDIFVEESNWGGRFERGAEGTHFKFSSRCRRHSICISTETAPKFRLWDFKELQRRLFVFLKDLGYR